MKTRHPFHLYGFEAFSGNEDKKANIRRNNVPVALIAQEISQVWGALSQELWIKTKWI